MELIKYYFNLFILLLIFFIIFFFKQKNETILETLNKFKNSFYIYLAATPIIICSINNDLWFLIAAGQKLLEKGFIKQELLTYHQGLYGIQQQWTIAIIFNVLYKLLGVFGPYLFTIFSVYLIIYALIKLINRINYVPIKLKKSNKQKKSRKSTNLMQGLNLAIVSIIINVFSYSSFITTRPYVFSTFLFLVEIYLLESFMRTKNKKFLYGLPIVSILIINCHASVWMMFFVFLLPYIVDLIDLRKLFNLFHNSFNFPNSKNTKNSKISNKSNKSKIISKLISNYSHGDLNKKEIYYFVFIIFISALVGFINPYGIDAITYGFHSYGIKEINDFIDEMKPTFYENSVCLLTFLPLVILPMITFISRIFANNKKIKMRYLYFALGTGLMTLLNRRNAIFFIVVMSMNIAYAFSTLKVVKKRTHPFDSENKKNLQNLQNIQKRQKNKKSNQLINLILTSAIFLVSITGCFISIKALSEYKIEYSNMFSYLDETTNKSNITLFTYYDVGGHAEFYGYKPFMDPRAEVLLKANNKKYDYFLDFYNFFNDGSYYDEFLNKYKFTHMIIPDYEGSLTVQKIKKDNRFKYVMKEDNFILFESIKYTKNK